MSVLSKIEKSFGSAREAGEKFKAVMSGVAKETESAGAAATRAAPKMSKFTQSILRVAKYRMIRAALRAVVDAVKEGAESFYNFSSAVGAPFAAAMDSVRASSTRMKNQVGAAFGELYTAIAPIILSTIELLNRLANALTMIFAAFSGKGGWYKAKEGFEDIGDAAGGAGSAAKEALRYLAPFDELNRLPSDNGSSGGGGGGGGGNFGDMYEWVPFEEGSMLDTISDFVSDKLQALDLLLDVFVFGVGAILAFSGANVPLGIGMMIVGAYKGYHDATENWDAIKEQLSGKFAAITALISTALLVIGAVLAFSGASIGLGIGLMVAGAAGLATVVAANWDAIKEKLEGPLGVATAIISGAVLVLGILLCCAGLWGPGIGLIVAGASGLAASVAANWDNLKSAGQTAAEKVKEGWESVKDKAKLVVEVVKDKWEEFKTGVSNLWDKGIEIGVSLVKKGWETVSGWFSGLGAKATTAWATIQTWLDKAKDSKWGWTTVQGWLNGLGEKVNTGWAKAQVWLDKAKDSKWGWTTITDWVKEKAGDGWAKAQVYLARTTQGDYKWSSITSWVKEKAGEGWAKAQVYLARTTSGDYKWTSITSWVKEKAGEGWAKALVYLARTTSGEYSWSSITSWISEKYGDGWARALVYLRKATGDEAWTTVAVWVSGFMGGTVNKAIGLARNAWTSVAQWIENNDLIGGVVSIGVALVQSGWSSIKNWLSGLAGTLGISVQFNAGGGAFYSNSWHSIPQYAGGTSNAHGSMFIAGEAGPEVVGHIGGRTEVLNKSQLAATMYSAVRSAMASVSFRMGGMPSVGFDSAAMEEVMYSAFVRAMNDTEADETIVLDGEVLYRKMVDRNRAATYRMGSNPMMSMA